MSQSKPKRKSKARRRSAPNPEPELTDESEACPVCKGPWEHKSKKTFLGFHKLQCTQCSNFELFPLSTAYRVFYWVVVCWILLQAILSLLKFSSVLGGAIALGTACVYLAPFAFALTKDHRLRQQRE